MRLTLTSMIRYVNQIFNLEMARVEELPIQSMYMSFIYQVACSNFEPTCMTHVQDLIERGLVALSDMPSADPSFHERRRGFPDALKLYFDYMEYFAGLHQIYKGIRRFTQVCQL